MSAGGVAAAVVLAACCLAASTGQCDEDAAAQGSATARDFGPATLSKIIPGVTTETEVQALLGKSQDMQFGSGALCPPKAADRSVQQTVDSWNYRGRDADGAYIVHIEFDANYVTYLITRIPINGVGVARLAKPQPTAEQPAPAAAEP